MAIITELRADARVEVVPISGPLLDRALDLFARRADKEWSLAECVSIEVMLERGITGALTADAHFKQAGFVAMMMSEINGTHQKCHSMIHAAASRLGGLADFTLGGFPKSP